MEDKHRKVSVTMLHWYDDPGGSYLASAVLERRMLVGLRKRC